MAGVLISQRCGNEMCKRLIIHEEFLARTYIPTGLTELKLFCHYMIKADII